MENMETEGRPAFSLEETNLIQIDLIKDSGKDPEEWIEDYSEKFREYVSLHPELVELYRKSPADAELLIKKALEESPEKPVN